MGLTVKLFTHVGYIRIDPKYRLLEIFQDSNQFSWVASVSRYDITLVSSVSKPSSLWISMRRTTEPEPSVRRATTDLDKLMLIIWYHALSASANPASFLTDDSRLSMESKRGF